jgi:hypothetical protein
VVEISLIDVALLPNRFVRSGGILIEPQLPERVRGQRRRAGVVAATREVRKGRLAKMMLSVDSDVYQWRYTADDGSLRVEVRDVIPAAKTRRPRRSRMVSKRRRGVGMKGTGRTMVRNVVRVLRVRVRMP